jgi:site-specific DNA-methyltransferase (adenine-specific)
VSRLAIDVVRKRIGKLGEKPGKTYAMTWEPRDYSGAEALAADDPYQFQDWIVKKLGGLPTLRRGADRGIDGRIYFKDHPNSPLQQIIVSVKSGRVTPAFVRELHGTVMREKAAMGILATLVAPTKAMERDAASYNVYKSVSGIFPRIQIVSAKEILAKIHFNNMPPIQRIDVGQRRPSSVHETQIPLPDISER